MKRPGKHPTEEHVTRLTAHLERVHRVSVVDKGSAPEHVVLGTLLQELHARTKGLAGMTREDWLTRYATTLGTRIAIPREWPAESRFWVLAHELQHALQWLGRQPQSDLPSGAGFALGYLASQGRVRAEVEAERARAEVMYACTGILPTVEDAVAHLTTDYLVTSDDRALAWSMWDAALPTLAEGVVSTEAARTVLDWIRRDAPELLVVES